MVLVQGGFLLPAKGKHVWTQIFGEQEIAMPVLIRGRTYSLSGRSSRRA
jgi:hypothetical protein